MSERTRSLLSECNAFCASDHPAVWYRANDMGDDERCPVCLERDRQHPVPEVTEAMVERAILAADKIARWDGHKWWSDQREEMWAALTAALHQEDSK